MTNKIQNSPTKTTKYFKFQKKCFSEHVNRLSFFKKATGFTIIELLAVMAVIGILTTIVAGGYRQTQRRGRDAQRKSDLKQMSQSLEVYLSDHGTYPQSSVDGRIMGCPAETTECDWGSGQFSDSTGNIYFVNLPDDPSSSQDYFYRAFDSNRKYQIFAWLENPKDQDCFSADCESETGGLPAGVFCGAVNCNYAAYSPNVKLAEVYSPSAPTSTPVPTSTPTPVSTPTSTPAPSSTSTPTPTPTSVPSTVEVRVTAGSDDAEERVSNGSVSVTGSDLELVTDAGNVQEVGIRFPSVSIPQGATILNAYVEFETDETSSEATNLAFYAEDTNDASTFTTSTGNITSRPKTSASAAWNNVPAWNTVNEKHQTPNLSSAVQEVVNRAGWSSGNDLVIIATGSGRRVAESYEGESANAPLLHVEYQ